MAIFGVGFSSVSRGMENIAACSGRRWNVLFLEMERSLPRDGACFSSGRDVTHFRRNQKLYAHGGEK